MICNTVEEYQLNVVHCYDFWNQSLAILLILLIFHKYWWLCFCSIGYDHGNICWFIDIKLIFICEICVGNLK